MKFSGKVAFALGTGRCGTYMAYEILRRDPAVAASHERNVFAECFHRYCTWYGLPVDDRAFVETKIAEIEADLADHVLSFEASAPLSFSIPVLYREFGARFVLFVRNPVDVVNSYLSKGWFEEEIYWQDHEKAPGYHSAHEQPHHFFGRLMPRGETYGSWRDLGRIGKLAWTWATVNRTIAQNFRELPSGTTMTIRLEDFDYECYRSLTAFLGRPAVLDRPGFEEIVGSRPNTRRNKPTVAQWSARDVAEFRQEIGTAAEEFGYEVNLTGAGRQSGAVLSMHGGKARRTLRRRVARGLRGAMAAFRAEFSKADQ
jgi:hypothetical protein